MASSANPPGEDPNKPVTGRPSQEPQVATGYPWSSRISSYFYILPPPSPHFPAGVRHPRRPDHHQQPPRSSLLRRISSLLLSCSFLFAFVYSIIWLFYRPLPPSFLLTSASASSSTATWNLSIQVTNLNRRYDILYDRLETAVLYDEVSICQAELPPFDQGKKNQTLLVAQLRNVDVSKAIDKEVRSGVVSCGVRVSGFVRFGGWGWKTRKRFMNVFCYGVEIGFNNSSVGGPGTLLNPLKECKVEI